MIFLRPKFVYLLTLLCIASLLLPIIEPSSVQAQSGEVLRWNVVEKPSRNNNIVVTPSEVTKIAVSTLNVIYAIDTPNAKLYKTVNAGASWTDITANLITTSANITNSQLINIAVAPDRPQIAASVTDNGTKVFLSVNGGESWNDTGTFSGGLTGTIQCIAISSSYTVPSPSGTTSIACWDIGIGTAIWSDNTTTGQVWTFPVNSPTSSSWIDQQVNIETATINADVSAIEFSPSYRSDSTILAVTSNSTASGHIQTWLSYCKKLDTSSPNNWHSPISIDPVSIAYENQDTSTNNIISDITLPSDYRANDSTYRLAFISYNRKRSALAPNPNNDLYAIADITPVRINTGSGLGYLDISTIAFYGRTGGSVSTFISGNTTAINTFTLCGARGSSSPSGKLLVGDEVRVPSSFFTQVRRNLNILTSSGAWQVASEPPTGPGNAQVAWSSDGTIAFCGTGQIPGVALDESAFSRSFDNGDSWEQTSLIDTIIKINDIAPAPDSRSLFIATFSQDTSGLKSIESVWRTTGDQLGLFWGRIISRGIIGPNKVILRMSPNYLEDFTIYAAEKGDATINTANATWLVRSDQRGNYWQYHPMPGPMIDLLVTGQNTLYVALHNGKLRRSKDGGIIWSSALATGLTEINMLSSAPNGHIFAGSTNGTVAYSVDEGKTFTILPRTVGNTMSGYVQVIPDVHYVDSNIIFAATDNSDDGIWRWVIGRSTEWEQIDKTITDSGKTQRISGMVMGVEGTLYASYFRATTDNKTDNRTSGMDRSLNPLQSAVETIEWDEVYRTLPVVTSSTTPTANVTFNSMTILPSSNPLYTTMMPLFRISGDSTKNDLWAINTDNLTYNSANITNIIYRFQDTLCKKGPWIEKVNDVGCDPATGRNQEVNFIWEQLSIASDYDLYIAKDKAFAMKIFGGLFSPAVITSPALVYLSGGEGTCPPLYNSITNASITTNFRAQTPSLECGHAYYWKVRVRNETTDEWVRSPWSDIGDIMIKAGFSVTTPYYGIMPLTPYLGCGCPYRSPISFSWTPYKETTNYLFELSDKADMGNILVSQVIDDVTTYQYTGTLKSNTQYFWHVRAQKPSPSDWSATFSFTVQPEVQQVFILSVIADSTPLWGWAIICIVFVLLVCMLVLIMRSSRN